MIALADLPLFTAAAQREHLDRVSSNLEAPILAFCRGRRQFHMDELRQHIVARGIACAPDSPSRILRKLKAEGAIAYRVVNRRASLYEIVA